MAITAQSLKGEFRQVAIEPIAIQAGDVIQQVGSQLIVTRDGQVIATRELTGESVSFTSVVSDSQVISSAVFFRSLPVSGVLATLLAPHKNNATGIITFPFSDGDSIELASIEEGMNVTNYLDTNNVIAKHVLIRKTLLNSPDGTDLHTMVGATCSMDCNANQPMSVRID
jgi:hypothetical protein